MTVDARISAVDHFADLVPATDRRAWAAAGRYPDRDLYALFAEHCTKHPDRAAVIDADGEISYAGLAELTRRLAAGFAGLGIGTGDVVGAQLPNSRLSCAVDLALAGLGAIVLPFPVGRGQREVASLLGRSGAVATITLTEHGDYPCAAHTSTLVGELPALRTVIAVGDPAPPGCVPFDTLLAADPSGFVPAQPDPDAPVRILVTSGSEAEPKMVLYSHNALSGGRGRSMRTLTGGTEQPRNFFLVPLGSAFGSLGSAVTIATHGGTLLLRPRFDVEGTLELIDRGRPTHVFGVPTMLRMLLDHPCLADTDVSSVRAVILGGAPLDLATVRRGQDALGCDFVNLYGSADGVNCRTTVGSAADRPGTVGRPDPDVAEIRIVDAELRDVPTGETGEIIARGPMTPMCYVGAPELNLRYRTAEGWVRTGDLGRLDADGYLTVVGRGTDVIIRGGYNISPAEVEALLVTHSDITDVACVPVPDPLYGERLCACVATNAELTLGDLTDHLVAQGLDQRKLPERLLVLPALPLGAAGKVDRRALQAQAATTAEPEVPTQHRR